MDVKKSATQILKTMTSPSYSNFSIKSTAFLKRFVELNVSHRATYSPTLLRNLYTVDFPIIVTIAILDKGN